MSCDVTVAQYTIVTSGTVDADFTIRAGVVIDVTLVDVNVTCCSCVSSVSAVALKPSHLVDTLTIVKTWVGRALFDVDFTSVSGESRSTFALETSVSVATVTLVLHTVVTI